MKQSKIKSTPKVRMLKIESVLTGISFRIEIKKFWGWSEPKISYAEDATFYNRADAEKWYKYLTGSKNKVTIIKQQ